MGGKNTGTRGNALRAGALLVCLVAGAVSGGCKSEAAKRREAAQAEEAKLRNMALALCPVDGAGVPDVSKIPPDIAAHIRKEDREYAPTPSEKAPKRTAAARGTPAAPATCRPKKVALQATTATVQLSRKTNDGATAEYSILFVKTSNGWKADYHLPEKDRDRKRAREVDKEVGDLIENHEWRKARKKLLEIQALDPSRESEIKEGLDGIEKLAARTVAGRWLSTVEKDAMTDRENVYMKLPASNVIKTRYASKRAALVARCVKGEPDVLVQVDAIVNGSVYGKTKTQFRFDAEPAQSITMTTAEDHKGLFFRQPKKWLRRLAEHSSGKLVVEIPLFGRVPEAVTFDLNGADKVIPQVEFACAK